MLDQSPHTAQDALDLINAGAAPLDFNSGLPVYRAAVKRLLKVHVSGLITHELSAIPMTRSFVEIFFDLWSQQPPASKKERTARSQWKSRLLTIARRLEGVPVVRTTDGWDAFVDAIKQLALTRNLGEQTMIPVTSSLRAAAVEEGLEPSDLTQDWLGVVMKASSPKRRNSLKKAAGILDDLWTELPEQIRPARPIGVIEVVSRKRKSLPLPVRVSEDLEEYLARRVAGTTVEGFIRTLTVTAGIKEHESTNIYRQATGWMFDVLCVVGELSPNADIGLADLARLDWMGKAAFEALADADSENGEFKVFPWNPITPETIYNRISVLITMFKSLDPTFLAQQVELQDPSFSKIEKFTPDKLRKTLKNHFKKEMTDAHRNFCRAMIQDRDHQRQFLNMHMICWSDAKVCWNTYESQSHHQKMQTMNLCILAAILSIVVNIPFRARTVTSMVMEGDHRDFSLPKGQKRIEFHIAPERMKVPKRFDATLDDTGMNRPRQILDWFIAGPRRELLRNPSMLRADNARPNLLFCGIGRDRYNRVLVKWSEEVGLRVTTHMFRHALASILINCCECSIEDAARMLGNSATVTERQYAFQDLMRRRGETLKKLEGYRVDLADTNHPGRNRKWKA
jgi:hypothetical protein